MNKIDLIQTEINLVKNQTENLIKKFSPEQWTETPTSLGSNLNWQIGHIFIANYLHGIASITGRNERIRAAINVKDFIQFYGMDSSPKDFMDSKPPTEELLSIYHLAFELIEEILKNTSEEELERPTEVPNPAGKTKYQALMWLFKHQSWHNGQIALLYRVLNQ